MSPAQRRALSYHLHICLLARQGRGAARPHPSGFFFPFLSVLLRFASDLFLGGDSAEAGGRRGRTRRGRTRRGRALLSNDLIRLNKSIRYNYRIRPWGSAAFLAFHPIPSSARRFLSHDFSPGEAGGRRSRTPVGRHRSVAG